MSDNDVGEMFLNFMLHEDLRKLCGVDFTLYYPEELAASTSMVIWERWQRCAMGLSPIKPFKDCFGRTASNG
jgi:hypothetical protein